MNHTSETIKSYGDVPQDTAQPCIDGGFCKYPRPCRGRCQKIVDAMLAEAIESGVVQPNSAASDLGCVATCEFCELVSVGSSLGLQDMVE